MRPPPPRRTPETAIALYLILVNLLTFAAFWVDKGRAERDERRIPEAALLGLAVIGGATGAIAAQQILRHKTKKEPFRTRLVQIAFVQGAVLAWILIRYGAT